MLNLNFEKNIICDAYLLEKQTRSLFKSKNLVSTSKPLEMIHINLLGHARITSLREKRYGPVIVDDFS